MESINNKIKVCFFINGFGKGGAERQCAYLINELKKDKIFEISLLYFFEGENFRLLDQADVKIFKIPSNSQYSFKNIPILKKLISSICPNIIFSWMRGPDVLSFFVKYHFPKIKWIIAERNSNYKPWWNFRFILRSVLGRFADIIICNSIGGRLYWEKRFIPTKKLLIIPNILYPVSIEKIQKEHIAGNPVVLFAGRFMYQKNILTIAESFCRLADKIKAARFYIIGKGELQSEIQAIIKKNGKEQEVMVLPFQENIFGYFLATDVFVNISRYEGLPNTIIENILFANKIVVSRIPEHEAILGAQYPYYVNNLTDVEEICNKILAALKDDKFKSHLQKANLFLDNLSADSVTEKYKNIFYQIA